MNSKQRRKDRRLFKYKVQTEYISYPRYCEIWDWTVKHFGNRIYGKKCRWREPWGSAGMEWQFKKIEDAEWFALKWL